MVKSYNVLKLGCLNGDNIKRLFSTMKPGYFLTSCGGMVCHRVKVLTRTFQGHVVQKAAAITHLTQPTKLLSTSASHLP